MAVNITLPAKAALDSRTARPSSHGLKAEYFPVKHAFAFTALAVLLLGCAQSNSTGPVFSDIPGVPSSQPVRPVQPPPPPQQPPPAPSVNPATPPPPPVSAPPLYIFAIGEFKHPGQIVWTNGMTLQDGIQAAGGFTEFARRRLFVYHPDGLAERIRLGPNFSLTNNPALRPGDKLVNPRD
jgi:hypothetical protein